MLILPRLRSDAPEEPGENELSPPMSESVPELAADSESIISRTLVAPVLVMSSRRDGLDGRDTFGVDLLQAAARDFDTLDGVDVTAGRGGRLREQGGAAATQAAASSVRRNTGAQVEYVAFMGILWRGGTER